MYCMHRFYATVIIPSYIHADMQLLYYTINIDTYRLNEKSSLVGNYCPYAKYFI